MDKPNKKSFGKGKPATRVGSNGKPQAKRSSKPGSDDNRAKPAFRPKKTVKTEPKDDSIRLNKYISNSGVCSRREADIYIQSGNVKVNGEAITELGYRVKPGDKVNFDGQLLTPEERVYILMNKPKGFTTSNEDAMDSRHVLDLLRGPGYDFVKPIGRMDKTTTGLLLLTNDNDVITKFNAPNQKTTKIYHVSLDKNFKYDDLERLQSGGIKMEEHYLKIDEATYIEKEPKTEVGIKLRTANVKVVRAIFEHLGYNVLKVDRVMFAGLTKKNLPRGNWRLLEPQEIINIKHF